MMPGMNPQMMKQAMKRLGIKQEELPADEVLILMKGKRLRITSPNVLRVLMQGEESFQITGRVTEETDEQPGAEISAEDLAVVIEQAGCSEQEARRALEEQGGDLAAAILALQKDE